MKHRHLPTLAALILLMATSTHGQTPSAGLATEPPEWLSTGAVPGVDDKVFAVVPDDEGSLYVGGRFSAIADTAANNIARWDGTRWSPMGEGLNVAGLFDGVFCLAVSGTNVYAGGKFSLPGEGTLVNVARWDGTQWRAMGLGMNAAVYSLAVVGTNVYAGGYFTPSPGVEGSGIAVWNGTGWSAVGSGLGARGSTSIPTAMALLASGTNLYVGGTFSSAGGIATSCVARWDGTAWSGMGSGMEGDVFNYPEVLALARYGDEIVAGGYFLTADGVNNVNLAFWDGRTWGSRRVIATGVVRALATRDNQLFVGGNLSVLYNFETDLPINNCGMWDGSQVYGLGAGIGSGLPSPTFGRVNAIGIVGDKVFAGGDFWSSGTNVIRSLAVWDGTSWAPPVPAPNLQASRSLVLDKNVLYAAATTYSEAGLQKAGVQKWDGVQWVPLGSGMTGPGASRVAALAVSGNRLYAGGAFQTAGASAAANIAQWDGTEWTPLGSGLENPGFQTVNALAVQDGNLFVGGGFTTAGGVTVNNIARWDGTQWSALGAGTGGGAFSSSVNALATSGGSLYAGGDFVTAGGVTVNSVGRWDGSGWSDLGGGVNGSVAALAVSGTDLYVAGRFTMAGGVPVTGIAKWDGQSWSPLGQGLTGPSDQVTALAAWGTHLYVAGSLTSVGGVRVNNIARWDGHSWSAVGAGVTGISIFAATLSLAVDESNLFTQGYFSRADGKACFGLARAVLRPPELGIALSGPAARISWPSDTLGFVLEDRTSTTGWIPTAVPVVDDGVEKSALVPTTSAGKLFRLRAN